VWHLRTRLRASGDFGAHAYIWGHFPFTCRKTKDQIEVGTARGPAERSAVVSRTAQGSATGGGEDTDPLPGGGSCDYQTGGHDTRGPLSCRRRGDLPSISAGVAQHRSTVSPVPPGFDAEEVCQTLSAYVAAGPGDASLSKRQPVSTDYRSAQLHPRSADHEEPLLQSSSSHVSSRNICECELIVQK